MEMKHCIPVFVSQTRTLLDNVNATTGSSLLKTLWSDPFILTEVMSPKPAEQTQKINLHISVISFKCPLVEHETCMNEENMTEGCKCSFKTIKLLLA